MNPITVCDPTTVDRQKDVVPCEMDGFAGIMEDQVSTQTMLKYNPNQKWYYFPEMTNDEIMVFK